MILAEDQALLREGLARLFVDLGHEVTSILADVSELTSRIASDDPDLVVLDIRMPPTHTDEGVTAARAIKAERPELGVLLLSQHVEIGPAADLLGHPAFGYLLKDRVLDIREFVDTCERISRGGSALDPKIVAALIAGNEVSPLGQLSERERQVLALMAEGLSNAAIADRLVLSARTVEAHVAHLLAKLDISDSQETNRRVLAVLAWLGNERDSAARAGSTPSTERGQHPRT